MLIEKSHDVPEENRTAKLRNDEAATLLVHFLGVVTAIGEGSLATTFIAALEPTASKASNFSIELKLVWGGRWGLNPRPPESQSGALPTELRPPQPRDYRVARPILLPLSGLRPNAR